MTSPGQLIAGQYRLVEEIGRGGFGVVWRARDERLRRDVAAKELFLPTYLGADQRHERRLRSLREARSAARLVHPAAVTVYDVVEQDGCPWIIMELINGWALNSLVKARGPLPPRRAAEIGLAVLGALQAAHTAGVVHRDVKPGNVLISDRRVVLSDFGIATIEGDPNLTNSGFVMGAPAYTAPERARGENALPASDLWSLGATLFYAVEGRRPYPGPNPNAVFHAILNQQPPIPRHAGMLAPVITGLLQPDVADRLTADEAAVLLTRVVAGDTRGTTQTDPTSAHRPSRQIRGGRFLMGAMAMVCALAAVVTSTLWPDPRPGRTAAHSRAEPTRLSLPATLTGAPSRLYAITFSTDGRTIATSGEDGVVRLWDVATRSQTALFRGHRYSVFAVAFSPDGRTLASGGYDGTVILWDTVSRQRVKTFPPVQNNLVSTLAFSPDGKMLASSSADSVRLWQVAGNRRPKTLGDSGERLFVAAYGHAGLAVAGTQTLRLWHKDGRPPALELGKTGSTVNAMAFNHDGSIIACGTEDGDAVYWSTNSRKRLGRFRHGYSVNGIAISPGNRTLAVASGHDVILWNLATKKRSAPLRGHTGQVSALAYSPDGTILASTAYDRTVRLWQAHP
jgi:eukaryotic-like serine/threonine-protein kinase